MIFDETLKSMTMMFATIIFETSQR